VRDRAKVLQPDQSPALVVNSGSWYSKLGSAPGLVGTLLSHASVESFGATVDGDLRTQSSYTPHNGAQVTGDVFQWASVPLPTAPSTPTVAHGTQDVFVNSGTQVLVPGDYRDLFVNSGWPSPTVVLSDGTYTFRNLSSNT